MLSIIVLLDLFLISFRNHRTCQLLQSISLHAMDFGHLSCLKAFTERVSISLGLVDIEGCLVSV